METGKDLDPQPWPKAWLYGRKPVQDSCETGQRGAFSKTHLKDSKGVSSSAAYGYLILPICTRSFKALFRQLCALKNRLNVVTGNSTHKRL